MTESEYELLEKTKAMCFKGLKMVIDEAEKSTTGMSKDHLCLVDMLTHTIKSIDTDLAMDDSGYGDEGYSGRPMSRYSGASRYPRMPKVSSRTYNGYSGHEEPEDDLEYAMRQATDERSREAIRRAMMIRGGRY